MIGLKRIHKTVNEIRNTYRSHNGGYIAYFKLWLQLLSQAKVLPASKLIKAYLIGVCTIQCLFKPLLFIFSTKEKLEGRYQITEDLDLGEREIRILDLKRSYSVWLFRIFPIWVWFRSVNVGDLKKHELA